MSTVMSLSLRATLHLVAVICLLHSTADATCTSYEITALNACELPFTNAHSSAFVDVAGASTCNLNVQCTVVSALSTCVNALPLTTACKQTLEKRFKDRMTAAGNVCTVTDLETLCPSAPRLDRGNSSQRPGGSVLLMAVSVICVMLYSLTN